MLNKINSSLHVVIFQLNFMLNLLVTAISDTLEHLYVHCCIKPIKTEAYFPVNIRSFEQKNSHALLTHKVHVLFIFLK